METIQQQIGAIQEQIEVLQVSVKLLTASYGKFETINFAVAIMGQ